MIKKLIVIGTACIAFNANAQLGAGDYSREGARKSHSVQSAVVESVRKVKIDGVSGNWASAAGAAVGGIAGSAIGGNDFRGQAMGTVLGSVLGGVAGHTIQKSMTSESALEIVVLTNEGRTLAIIQGADEFFEPGQKVRLIDGPSGFRVVP